MSQQSKGSGKETSSRLKAAGKGTRSKMKAYQAEEAADSKQADRASPQDDATKELERPRSKAGAQRAAQAEAEAQKSAGQEDKWRRPTGQSEEPQSANADSTLASPQANEPDVAKGLAEDQAAQVSNKVPDKVTDSELDQLRRQPREGLWKSKVLAAYKKGPRDSNTLLQKIQNGKGTLELSEHYKVATLQETMIKIVDKMFDYFQNAAYEFNQTEHRSDMELTWMRPALTREAVHDWHQTESFIVYFSGRVSSRYWSMVIRGTHEMVDIYMLPADKLIAFGMDPQSFLPYLQLLPQNDQLDVFWKIDGQRVPAEALAKIETVAFDAFIGVVRGEATGFAKFDPLSIGLSPPPSMASPMAGDDEAAIRKKYEEQFFADFRDSKEHGEITSDESERPIQMDSTADDAEFGSAVDAEPELSPIQKWSTPAASSQQWEQQSEPSPIQKWSTPSVQQWGLSDASPIQKWGMGEPAQPVAPPQGGWGGPPEQVSPAQPQGGWGEPAQPVSPPQGGWSEPAQPVSPPQGGWSEPAQPVSPPQGGWSEPAQPVSPPQGGWSEPAQPVSEEEQQDNWGEWTEPAAPAEQDAWDGEGSPAPAVNQGAWAEPSVQSATPNQDCPPAVPVSEAWDQAPHPIPAASQVVAAPEANLGAWSEPAPSVPAWGEPPSAAATGNPSEPPAASAMAPPNQEAWGEPPAPVATNEQAWGAPDDVWENEVDTWAAPDPVAPSNVAAESSEVAPAIEDARKDAPPPRQMLGLKASPRVSQQKMPAIKGGSPKTPLGLNQQNMRSLGGLRSSRQNIPKLPPVPTPTAPPSAPVAEEPAHIPQQSVDSPVQDAPFPVAPLPPGPDALNPDPVSLQTTPDPILAQFTDVPVAESVAAAPDPIAADLNARDKTPNNPPPRISAIMANLPFAESDQQKRIVEPPNATMELDPISRSMAYRRPLLDDKPDGFYQRSNEPKPESKAPVAKADLSDIIDELSDASLVPDNSSQWVIPDPFHGPGRDATQEVEQQLPAHLRLTSALTQLIAALEAEMNAISIAGSDAFVHQDFERADQALRFAARLNDFKLLAKQLLDDYNDC